MFVTHKLLYPFRDSFVTIRPKRGLIDPYRSNLEQLRNVGKYWFFRGSRGPDGTRNPTTLAVLGAVPGTI